MNTIIFDDAIYDEAYMELKQAYSHLQKSYEELKEALSFIENEEDEIARSYRREIYQLLNKCEDAYVELSRFGQKSKAIKEVYWDTETRNQALVDELPKAAWEPEQETGKFFFSIDRGYEHRKRMHDMMNLLGEWTVHPSIMFTYRLRHEGWVIKALQNFILP